MKHPQSSSENRTADGENHLDMSLEEEEVSDMSPKKSLELGDGSKLYGEPHRLPSIVVYTCICETEYHVYTFSDSLV